jgi:P4 family phage/plasmid primase-like protien
MMQQEVTPRYVVDQVIAGEIAQGLRERGRIPGTKADRWGTDQHLVFELAWRDLDERDITIPEILLCDCGEPACGKLVASLYWHWGNFMPRRIAQLEFQRDEAQALGRWLAGRRFDGRWAATTWHTRKEDADTHGGYFVDLAEPPDEPPPSPQSEEEAMKKAARSLRESGIAIVWLEPGEKRPKRPDWTLKSQETDDYRPGNNLGVLCGRLSGDLVCVDPDTPITRALGEWLLPPTGMRDGRHSTGPAHWFYRVHDIPEEMTSKGAAGGIGGPWLKHFPGMDFVGTGGQVVVPPSMHRSGERRVWYSHPRAPVGMLTTVPMVNLWERVQWIALLSGCDKPELVKLADGLRVQQYLPAIWEAVNRGDVKAMWSEIEKGGMFLGNLSIDQRVRDWCVPADGQTVPQGEPLSQPPPDIKDTEDCSAPLSDKAERCRAYLANVPPAISGQGGHDRTFRTARIIANDFDLAGTEEGWNLLNEYNQRCEPPWSEGELRHKWEDACKAPPQEAHPRGGKLVVEPSQAPPNDPHRLAASFVQAQRCVYRFWNGTFHRHDGKRYQEMPGQELTALVNAHCEAELRASHHRAVQASKRAQEKEGGGKEPPTKAPVKRPVTCTLVNNVISALSGQTLIRSAVRINSLLPDGECRPWVALKNGILDIDTGELRPHTPEWFSTCCLPYDHDPKGACETWLATLDRCFDGDGERVALLQEWFGYCLTSGTDLQAFLIVAGEGGTGKSTICAALRAVLGEENVSSVGLEAFSERFGLWPTVGKLANISAEIGELDRCAEGKLKAYTSGDPLTLDRKGLVPVTISPTAKLVFATNNPPRFSDKSQGLWRRLFLMPCDVVIPKKERVPGMDKAEWWEESGELPGILNWALEGLRRLRQAGQFTRPKVMESCLGQHRRESNPARLFLEEECRPHDDASTSCEVVYNAYVRWCERNGFRYKLTANDFGREVRRVYTSVERKQQRKDGKQVWQYVGLSLVNEPVTDVTKLSPTTAHAR